MKMINPQRTDFKDTQKSKTKKSQRYLFLCPPGTVCLLSPYEAVMHQEEARTHCTSDGSDSGSKDLIPKLNGIQGAVAYPVEVCVSLLGYGSLGHHLHH